MTPRRRQANPGVEVAHNFQEPQDLYENTIAKAGLASGDINITLTLTDWRPEAIQRERLAPLDPFLKENSPEGWPDGWSPSLRGLQRDAARIEGASNLRILTNIILPLSKPALATVAIFAFVGNWNNLLAALIYLRSTDQFTLAIGLNLFYGQSVTAYNQLMAVSILTILPIVVTFFFAQKYFIRGVVLSVGER